MDLVGVAFPGGGEGLWVEDVEPVGWIKRSWLDASSLSFV